jgi:hypothetical protein
MAARDGARLPHAVPQAMAAGERCVGRTIDVALRRIGTRVLCQARSRDRDTALSRRQHLVTDDFAQGSSHKEVARVCRCCWAYAVAIGAGRGITVESSQYASPPIATPKNQP